MELPNNDNLLGFKRKRAESCIERACKTARLHAEHGPCFHSCTHECCCCPKRPTLTDNFFNYLKSGVPQRIMFYKQGEWLNIPESVAQTLIEGFRDKRSSYKVSVDGQPLLIDFLSMVLIYLNTRKSRSVAWIDEAGKCFFPTFFVDEVVEDSAKSAFEIVGSSTQMPEVRRISPPEVVKHVVMEDEAPALKPPAVADILRTKIEKLERDSESFLFVQKLFLSGMGPFATPQNIKHIHRYAPKDISAAVRLQAFERQIRSTEAERGAANVQYGWFGSKKLDLVGILIHGFGNAGKPTEGGVLGTGIYVTPENRSFASVNLCDVDEKGSQYMLLCRLVLGNTEQVQPGSKQWAPGNLQFDSGVDDALSPKCFVMWSNHLNSYIHPEFVVSFNLSPHVREYLSGLHDIRYNVATARALQGFSTPNPAHCEPVRGPHSPWMPFSLLFAEIQDSISPLAKELLCYHYQELKRNAITREEMVKKMRILVDQNLLLSTLKRLKRSPSSWYASGGKKAEHDLPGAPEPKSELLTEPSDLASSKMNFNNSASLAMMSPDFVPSAKEPNDSTAPTGETNKFPAMVSKLNVSSAMTLVLNDSTALTMEVSESAAPKIEPNDTAARRTEPYSWI